MDWQSPQDFEYATQQQFIPCSGPQQLPSDMRVQAAEIAVKENAQNRPILDKLGKIAISIGTQVLTEYIKSQGGLGGLLGGILGGAQQGQQFHGYAQQYTQQIPQEIPDETLENIATPERLAVLTTKYWRTSGVKLGVAFMENTTNALASKILQYANLWSAKGNVNVKFELVALGNAEIRVSRGGGGYWAYLGTDNLSIPRQYQNVNLEGFTLRTADSEYNRVVTHEFGHVLGFPHEHMRAAIIAKLNREATINYFMQTQGWSRQEVIAQVLTAIPENQLLPTSSVEDETSVMTYQLPGSITNDGQPIRGGSGINETDYKVAAKTYPVSTPVEPTKPDPNKPDPNKPDPNKPDPTSPVAPEGRGVLVINGVNYNLTATR
jgi:hypothetical protein